MDIHNTTEDIVFSVAQTIFNDIEKEGNPGGFCFCDQCRMDTICYALNRLEPHYIVSNRGITRIEQDGMQWQQIEADIATLVYKGLRLVNHFQRPTAPHDGSSTPDAEKSEPSFDIPTIIGRLFDGVNFAPVSGVTVTLRRDGELVAMRNLNWQNPYTLISNTPGTYTFWPAPIPAEAADLHKTFEYSLKIEGPDYDPLTHFFKIPAVGKIQTISSYSLDRTFKLPDLYLFPPGEAEQNG
ncbi:MAG: late competence development ComFB family protein [Treponema sp.]|jgi:competence protein ComFB|nr:late competence development ComFB family protein [Treponema sp.]